MKNHVWVDCISLKHVILRKIKPYLDRVILTWHFLTCISVVKATGHTNKVEEDQGRREGSKRSKQIIIIRFKTSWSNVYCLS